MTATVRPVAARPATALRSAAAVLVALVANALASAAVDQVLVWLGVFPLWGQITHEPLPYALALTYRTLFGVASAWLAAALGARWAPTATTRPALWLGAVGSVLSVAGLVAALTRDLGPIWYPALLLAITMPAALLGERLHGGR